jgi:hypothetical protein
MNRNGLSGCRDAVDRLTPAGWCRFIPGALAHHPIDRLAAVAKTAQFAAPADLQASFLIKVRF